MSGSGRPSVAIRITAEGAEEARRKLQDLGRDGAAAADRVGAAHTAAAPAMQRMTALAGGAGAAFAALGVAAGAAVLNIARVGDAMQATMGRLSAATGNAASARDVYEQLFRLSQQTGMSVGEAAGAFGRFRVAADAVGATNAQVIRLVEGLQKAAIVSGASGQEAAAAMQQFGQALASGKLQGDELRSLIENMPQYATALARELGLSVGEMRELASKGEIVASKVLPAAIRAGERFNAEFEKMPLTMERSFGILGEAMKNFVGSLDEALGISQAIAVAVKAAADAVNVARRAGLRTEAEQIADRRAALSGRILPELRARAAEGADRGQFPDGAAGDRLFAAAQANRDPRAGVDLRAAEAENIALGDRLAELQREAQERQFGEYVAAQQKMESTRRETAKKEFEELRTSLDKDYKARQEHAKRIKTIGEALASGGISAAEARAARTLADKELAESLAKGTEKVKEALGEQADAHVKAWQNSSKAAKKAFEDAAREAERFRESSINAVASSFERAFDRLGDALSQVFVNGTGKAVNFGNIARSIFGSLASDFIKLGAVNPILNSVLGGTQRPTLGGAGFGLGDLLGGLPNLSGLGDMLGIGMPSLGGLGGLGSLLGPAAGMFGVGSFLGSLVAGNSPARQTNAMIGAGLGTALGLIGGGPIGAIAGGLIGGLFGPNESKRKYGYRVTGTGEGGLAPLDYTYYNASGEQQFRDAEAKIASINAYVKQRGLTIEGSRIVGGNKDGPDLTDAHAGSFDQAFSMLYFGAKDSQLNAALSGQAFGSPQEWQAFVESWTQVRDTIRDLTDTAEQKLNRQLEAVNAQFDELASKAREYGLSEAGLAAARERSLAAVRGQQAAEGRALLADLAFGRSSALAPEQQYFAALSTLNQARASLDAGGSLAEYASVAQQVLPVARDFLGTSTRYANLTAEVAQTVAGRGGDPSGIAALVSASANGMSSLEATLASLGERQLGVASATLAEMRRLAATIEALIARQKAA